MADPRTTLTDLMAYSLQIAEGLSRAHGAGIAPGSQAGEHHGHDDRLIKILDFVVAKTGVDTDVGDRQTEASLTRAGASVGTFGYMSPEQALGAPSSPSFGSASRNSLRIGTEQ